MKLTDLPTECIYVIMTKLPSWWDCVRFARTCKKMAKTLAKWNEELASTLPAFKLPNLHDGFKYYVFSVNLLLLDAFYSLNVFNNCELRKKAAEFNFTNPWVQTRSDSSSIELVLCLGNVADDNQGKNVLASYGCEEKEPPYFPRYRGSMFSVSPRARHQMAYYFHASYPACVGYYTIEYYIRSAQPES